MNKAITASLLIIAGLLTGCKTASSVKPVVAVPGWVLTPPKDKGRLCAVGASEPTYYKEDGKTYAAENARKELARSLNITIKSIMVDINSGKGGYRSVESVSEVSAWASDAVLRDSEIAGYWYDEDGTASFRRTGITYALACMPINSAAKDISRSMPDENTQKEVIERLQNINER